MRFSNPAEIRKIIDYRTVSSPAKIASNFIKHNLLPPPSKPFLPAALCLYVTHRCNMRCRICGIWRQSQEKPRAAELSPGELEQILSDRLFSRLEYININGGEPNLREDLPELAELFINKFKRLKTITVNSNGLPFERAVSNAERISRLCRDNDVRFSISVSLHKIGDGYDDIAGVENAYPRVMRTLRALRDLRDRNGFYLGVNCVMTGLNVFDLPEMRAWSERENIPANFTLGEVRERFDNLDMKEDIEVRGKAKTFLIRFLRDLGKEKSPPNQHALRYRELAEMIEFNRERTLSCHYAMGGVILGAEGSLYYCKKSRAIGNCREKSPYSIYYDEKNLKYRREVLLDTECRKCPPNTFNRIELEKDLFKYLKFLVAG